MAEQGCGSSRVQANIPYFITIKVGNVLVRREKHACTNILGCSQMLPKLYNNNGGNPAHISANSREILEYLSSNFLIFLLWYWVCSRKYVHLLLRFHLLHSFAEVSIGQAPPGSTITTEPFRYQCNNFRMWQPKQNKFP